VRHELSQGLKLKGNLHIFQEDVLSKPLKKLKVFTRRLPNMRKCDKVKL